MADPKKMSVQEMLAAARASAGVGSKPDKKDEPAAEGSVAETSAAESPKTEKKKPTAPVKAGGSVADILAAARASAGAAPDASQSPAEEVAEKPAKPAAKPASGKAMSVADMLAAARGEKSGAPAAPKEKAAPAAKKAAAEPKAKAETKEPVADKAPTEKIAAPRDTQSILAAARKTEKAGPMSKAEAAGIATDSAKPGKPAKAPKVVPPMPEKPAYARPIAAAKRVADEQEDRRGFFGLLLGSYLAVGFTTLGLTNLLWTLGFARFMFPNILTEPPTRFKVGPPSNFAPGQVETKFVAQFGVWVVNTLYQGAQIIFALRTVCTHLGCTPNWLEAEQKFKCPCHGSGFYKDGINFEGPAPRPLERYAISVAADGQLEIDKSKLFQEEKGQWSDPASKVLV